MFFNVFTLLYFLGGFFMKISPVFIDPNNLMSFVSSDIFGACIILVILVATLICMIVGRKE